MKLSSEEKIVFCKIALTISRKGHLTQDALVRFCLPKHERKYGKKLITWFYYGVRLAIKYCSRFRWKYIK